MDNKSESELANEEKAEIAEINVEGLDDVAVAFTVLIMACVLNEDLRNALLNTVNTEGIEHEEVEGGAIKC